MVKKVSSKKTEQSMHGNYKLVAEDFYEGAKTAYEFEYYNAAGVLIIHAAIALADAVTIKLSSQKSSGDEHYEVINLLNNVTPASESKSKALKHLGSLIEHKNFISYSGEIYHKKDIQKLMKHFERLKKWTDSILV